MSWFSAYNPYTSPGANITSNQYAICAANPAAFDQRLWPAHDMDDGLDLPTFDLYVKCMLVHAADSTGRLEVLEQQVSVGRGLSFNVLRRSAVVIRKHADGVEFQGSSRVSYAKLKPFVQEFLVLHHTQLQRKKVVVGLIGFAWDIKHGLTDMLIVVSPALDLEFAEHGTLANYLRSKPLSQSFAERRLLCRQVLAGLACLHDYHIVHGDLKLDNILVCSSKGGSGIVAKLSDFGLSMFVTEMDATPTKLPGGTRPWNAPEWRELRSSRDFYKSDIYSAGLLIWACFSIGEDPFNLEGHNIYAEPDLLPPDNREQKLRAIDDLKKSDKILEIACCTTVTTLASFKEGSRGLQNIFLCLERNADKGLLTALKAVYESTLQLDIALRSLQPAIKALETEIKPTTIEENKDDWWGAMYLNPRLVSPKTLQLGLLRGSNYIVIPGAPMIARLSVAISRAIFLTTSTFTVERRRDAAFFLFRSYLENYGVEESEQNMEQAAQWLNEFGRLGMITQTEGHCFDIAEFSTRIGHELPQDFPFENSSRIGLRSVFNGGSYIRHLCRERVRRFPNLFEEVLLCFKKEGLRRLLPQYLRSSNLSTIVSAIGSGNAITEAVALLHIAASCGDIQAASLLVEKYDLDLNTKANFQDITALVTALKFSQTEFILWLLSQGVRAGLQDQKAAVLCFLCNFDIDDASALCNALCKAGASVNDWWYFDYRFVSMSMLSFATWAFDLAMIELLLAQQPSIKTCQEALRWACGNGRLDVLMRIESHLTLVLESPPGKSDWELGLSNILYLSPYQKIFLPYRPDFVGTTKYIVGQIGEALDPKALFEWLKMAIILGDSESFRLYLEQAGSSQIIPRTRLIDEKQAQHLEKSALESVVIFDRKEIFDILIERGTPIELEQAEGNFPTILHSVAQRDTLNGIHFCREILAKGDKLETKASPKLSEATALEVAVRYNNYEIADLLLQQGACIDGLSAERPSPLGELINVHSREALVGIKFLLKHPNGKPSFVVDRDHGRTALHLASGPDYDYDWQYLEGIDGHEAILDLILEHYCEPQHLNYRDKCGFTALHHASYRGCKWAVRKLLQAGADPNLYSCTGIRPLDCARQTWGLSIALDNSSPNFNVSSPASQARRAAARLECVELLTAAGAGDLGDSVIEMGLRRFILGCLGLINNAKGDDEAYEPWIGEFPLRFVTRWLAGVRNKRAHARSMK